MNSGSPPDLRQIFLSGFAPKRLIGDEHVSDPAMDPRLGLADLLAAHADGAERDLLQCDDRAFQSRPFPATSRSERAIPPVSASLRHRSSAVS
jgi:hypothetical protein